ncbi:MAG: bifunctional [glutamate--ammonia ligase]-adenylyl-L-tyrosine phosphorylase/[glutamate--ammonia-ligase] adenylyltransferase, partial [Myxococcales bacterium]|nr:bifunctional [glutamate--ammonia ligase]-adenylyl-L-tyrosine phosphorylase/[glutamate--ammonia-ligase] adenylyltransferase [Myxococcales bacterium]
MEAFVRAGGSESNPDVTSLVATLGEHAPALLPLAIADVALPEDVLGRPLTFDDDRATLRQVVRKAVRGLGDGPELDRALRRARHRGVVRIALREVLRIADVDQTAAEIAHLAGAVVDAALDGVKRTLVEQHGEARDTQCQRIPFVVMGMGKLGGDELNIGSDIDLCFYYGTDEGSVDDGELTVHAYFAKLATRLVRALSEVTDHGACFRVDLRLRPEGTRGPVANSIASAERYYETWGGPYDRLAWLKARPAAGDRALGEELMSVMRPFVFPRTVDHRITHDIRELMGRIRAELRERSGMTPGWNVKLGRGG